MILELRADSSRRTASDATEAAGAFTTIQGNNMLFVE